MSNDKIKSAMRRALELALLGPAKGVNPQVGAVILDKHGEIIAEGWHRGSGTPHAEVDALSKLDRVPAGATAVVTLEPCNHTGKTGPCSQALIEAGISTVVYAVDDPGQESAGGAQTLRAAFVEVIDGVLADEAEEQGRVWLTAHRKQRPYVTLKWASSFDGRAAANDRSSKWISGSESRADAHLRRSEADAILVGTGTVLADDPELTARHPDGTLYETQPLRVIVGESELPIDARVFNSDAQTIQLKTRSLFDALQSLWTEKIKHVFVEGGPRVASEFIRLGLVDEYVVYQAPMMLGGEKLAVGDIGIENISQAQKLRFAEVKRMGDDIFVRANPIKEAH